jgi:hypothetical protein
LDKGRQDGRPIGNQGKPSAEVKMRNDIVENDYVAVWIEDGILFGLYKKNCIIGLEAAKEIVALRKQLTKEVPYPCIAYINYIKVVTKEARKYLASEDNGQLLKLALTDSGFSKILGNIFLSLDKPIMPTRLFTKKDEAVKWLKHR